MTRFGCLTALILLNVLVYVYAVFVFGTDVLPSAFPSLAIGGVLIWGLSSLITCFIFSLALRCIPNGLPLHESELTKRRVFRVLDRFQTILYLSANGIEARFYFFDSLPPEVEIGQCVVYLDNLESEFLAKWHQDGVIPILSADGRALKGKEGESGQHQAATLDLDSMHGRLKKQQANA